MSSMPSISRRRQRPRRGSDLEADVVEALALARQEARDAGRVVGRLDELDLRLPHPQERDPDAVVGDVHDGLELEPERVAPEPERRVDRAHDERDMVDAADSPMAPDRRSIGGVVRVAGSSRSAGSAGLAASPAAYPVGHAATEARQRDRRADLCRRRSRRRGRAGTGPRASACRHVTVLFPFLPARGLRPEVRRELASIAADHQPFDVRFAAGRRFPGVVYVGPEPAAPFTRLTEAVVARTRAFRRMRARSTT